ncbi:MAG: S-adenosylmethionine tRNA ribosyltransferase [Porphyromonadaceae bacterium CG2_30_38_12]|nr:MAG: S-adenosylmethionine tRNA ribosyltransferase [Porphyromonadaceae bacterium CG2_30_38_12]
MKAKKNEETILIEDFNYELPDARIAKFPVAVRDKSKLLLYKQGHISQDVFSNIASYLPTRALLVCNNTRVIEARLVFRKNSGARIEVFCLEPIQPADYTQALGANTTCEWKCMIGNLKKWHEGTLCKTIQFATGEVQLCAERLATNGNAHRIKFSWNNSDIQFAQILEQAGELPIPPYLHRHTETSDQTNYQTVYSKIKGSVAAPTAGLHFTSEVFKSFKKKQIEVDEVTLHVGAGTFQPVKTKNLAEHQMHTEYIEVKRETIENLQKNLGKIIAVGTTSVRTLESLYFVGNILASKTDAEKTTLNLDKFHIDQWLPYESEFDSSAYEALQHILDYLDRVHLNTLRAETQILIKPGYKFRIINGMITNFHQPKSTLLLLVSAFVEGNWEQIYEYALANDFRFLSYGDSSLLMR